MSEYEKPVMQHSTGSVQEIDFPRGNFWPRVFAAFIDVVLVSITAKVVGALLIGVFHVDQTNYIGLGPLGFNLIFGMLNTLVLIAYPTHKYGKTLGKHLIGLQVVHSESSEKLSLLHAFLREYVLKIISYGVFFIGVLMVAFRKDKRALHDMMGKTIVVKVPEA